MLPSVAITTTQQTTQLTGSASSLSTGGGGVVGSGPWWNSRCSFPEFRSSTNCLTRPGLLSAQPQNTHCNSAQFWHPGTLTLRAEHHSARMSKITNDDLTPSGTGCFIAVPISQQWASKGYRHSWTSQLSWLGLHWRINYLSEMTIITWRGKHWTNLAD